MGMRALRISTFLGATVLCGAGYGLVRARREGKDALGTLKEVGAGAMGGSTAGLVVAFTGRGAVSAYLDRKNTERLKNASLPAEAVPELQTAAQSAKSKHEARVATKKVAMKYVGPEVKQQQSTAEKVMLRAARAEARSLWG